MNATAKRYRIPCECGAELLVGPGNAGGQITCEHCGRLLVVPRLRDLGAAVADEPPPQRSWKRAHGWLLTGSVVAALSAVAALAVPRWLGGGPPQLPDEKLIRAAIESVDAATIYRAWQAMRGSGVDRGTLPAESRLQQAAGAAGRIAAVFWTIAAAGGLAALAGVASGLAGPPQHGAGPGPRRRPG